ncbi:MAG: AI-2E family transporter, partial [Myxococcota bacterium]
MSIPMGGLVTAAVYLKISPLNHPSFVLRHSSTCARGSMFNAVGLRAGTWHGRRVSGPHLWEIRAIRDLLALSLAICLLWLVVRAQSATVPVLIGFGLAYLADPVLKAAKQTLGVSRGVSIGVALLTILGSTAAFFGVVGPMVIREVKSLRERLPRYLQLLETEYGVSVPVFSEALADAPKDPQRLADYLKPALGWVG